MPSLLKKLTPARWLSSNKASNKQEGRANQEQKQQEADDSSQGNTSTTSSSCRMTTVSGRRQGRSTSGRQAKGSNTRSAPCSNRFLLEAPVLKPVALLDRREVQLGKLLGEGSFCEVREVTGFALRPPNAAAPSMPSCCREGMDQRRRERRRQDLANSTLVHDNGMARYALKQISTKLLLVPGGFHQAAIDLVTEANFLMRIDHPNILKVHAMALDGRTSFENKAFDNLFLVADRLSGTLESQIDQWKDEGSAHLKTHPAVLLQKTNYALQIVSALEHLHQRRLIFRDLKPSNCGFLPCTDQNKSTPKMIQLFDFGFCRELPEPPQGDNYHHPNNDQLFHMSRVGTPAYMAPEVSSSKDGYNTKADVFSFACLYYEMLVLKHPMKKKRRRTAKEERPDLSKLDLPPSIQDVLQSTWHPSIEKRSSSSQTRLWLQGIVQELEGRFEEG